MTKTCLTQEQVSEIKKDIEQEAIENPNRKCRPCRFLISGQAVNIQTGELSSKGSNVIYHPVYWGFSKTNANKVGKMLGARVAWSC